MMRVWAALSYFNPRPPRGGRHQQSRPSGEFRRISIHALREEGDEITDDAGEGFDVFQSTPSARRATLTYNGQAQSPS